MRQCSEKKNVAPRRKNVRKWPLGFATGIRQLWEEMATKWRHLAKQVPASSR